MIQLNPNEGNCHWKPQQHIYACHWRQFTHSIAFVNSWIHPFVFIPAATKFVGVYSGLPAVREKSGKKIFFKVREKSGNSVKSQGKTMDMGKSGKSQGILWWMPMILFTRGQFWPSGIVIACVCGSVCPCVCVYQSRACPDDNSSPIRARITKFGPEMQNTLVWVPSVFGDDQPWSSRSNLTWKSNFTSFWACSHHYSSAIQARITKFGPKMHLSIVKIPTNFGLDWLWSSLSFATLKPIFLPNLFAPFLYIFSETRRL